MIPVSIFFLLKKINKRERELKHRNKLCRKQPVVSSVRPSDKDWQSF